jgi:hypothetical protein
MLAQADIQQKEGPVSFRRRRVVPVPFFANMPLFILMCHRSLFDCRPNEFLH